MSKILDVWTGDTITHKGRRYFDINGELVPAEGARSGPPSLFQRVRKFLKPRAPHLHPLPSNPELGGIQGWEEALDTIIADGTQVSNTVTETIVCPDFNIPAFYMAPGRILRLWVFGVCSNVVTTPGTLTLRVRWGGASGVVLLASAAIGLDTTARTNALWGMSCYHVCRTAGATGSFMSGGDASVVNVLASVGITNNGVFGALRSVLGSAGTPIASGNAAVTVDTTIAKLLSVTATFSVATSPTNLTCQMRVIEALN